MHTISTEDIGTVTARFLTTPDEFNGKTIDELTVEELQEAFDRATGERVWKVSIPNWIAMRFVRKCEASYNMSTDEMNC